MYSYGVKTKELPLSSLHDSTISEAQGILDKIGVLVKALDEERDKLASLCDFNKVQEYLDEIAGTNFFSFRFISFLVIHVLVVVVVVGVFTFVVAVDAVVVIVIVVSLFLVEFSTMHAWLICGKIELSSTYYELIPRAHFSHSGMALLDNEDALQNEARFVASLHELCIARKVILAASNKMTSINPLDYVFKAIDIKMDILKREEDEFKVFS